MNCQTLGADSGFVGLGGQTWRGLPQTLIPWLAIANMDHHQQMGTAPEGENIYRITRYHLASAGWPLFNLAVEMRYDIRPLRFRESQEEPGERQSRQDQQQPEPRHVRQSGNHRSAGPGGGRHAGRRN